MTAAQQPTGPDWTAGHALLAAMARTGTAFSANQIRGTLRDLGFGQFTSGQLFQQAKAEGVIRRVGVEVSSDGPTHGAFVRTWIGAGAGALDVLIPRRAEVVVPVTRSGDGRFVAAGLGHDVPLFEVGAE